MKFIILTILICFVIAFTNAQQIPRREARNTVYLELGGTAYLYSINLQRNFLLNPNKPEALEKYLSLRFGLSPYSKENIPPCSHSLCSEINHPLVFFPFGIDFDIGKNNHFFHLGAGRTVDAHINPIFNTNYSNTNISFGYVRRLEEGFYYHLIFNKLRFDQKNVTAPEFLILNRGMNIPTEVGLGFGITF